MHDAGDLYAGSETVIRLLRNRSHEDARHVHRAVMRWLTARGASCAGTHRQEILAGRTPIGQSVRIWVQAARTPIYSSLSRLLARARQDPLAQGVTLAIALPDLPRLRREARRVALISPDVAVTWLFVASGGAVAVVPPPRADHGAAEGPSRLDQSSMRSEGTA